MNVTRIEEWLSEVVQANVSPGAAIALSVDGQRMEAARGVANIAGGIPLSAQSRFQLGCIAKVLSSLVALELASAGRLALDAPIGRYLPEMSDLPLAQAVCVRHLLAHTSGYQGPDITDPAVRYYYSWPKFLQLLHSGATLFTPGSVFNYEHTECVMLGEIAHRITGEHIHDLFDRMILQPLGIQTGSAPAEAASEVMDHSFDATAGRYTVLRPVPRCAFWEASLSDRTLSLRDLVTIGEALAGIREPNIFSPRTLEIMRLPCIALPATVGGTQREQLPLAFGSGCAQYTDSVFGHNGSARGQTCALRFDVASRLVFAVGLSCWRANVRDLLCRKLIGAFSGRVSLPAAVLHADEPFSELPGHYTGASGVSVDVMHEDDRLHCVLRSRSNRALLRLVVKRSAGGALEAQSDAAHLSIGFFRDQVEGVRGLMLGLNAYRRDS